MNLTVRERGDSVATFRWVEVRLMEMLAAWVPTTPEMEVKLVFGAHIWETAQHADALGKRTAELRLPLQDSLEPVAAYVTLLEEVSGLTDTAQRVAGLYDCLLGGMAVRYRDYLARVDDLLDAPTVRIVDRILADMGRMTDESRGLRREVVAARLDDQGWTSALRQRDAGIGDIVAYRKPVETR
jgi:hypothetical protein